MPGADARCRPLVTLTTAGQRHDSLSFELLMDELRVLRNGPGRPRTRPDELLADKAYSSRASVATSAAAVGSPASTRPPTASATSSSGQCTSCAATRYDKRDFIYRGTIDVASIRIWLRDAVSTDMRETA